MIKKKILEYNNGFMKKVLKSALHTLYIILFTVFGLGVIFDLIFQDADSSFIVSFYISIIFTMFYCTITIIEEIRRIK